MSEPTFSLYVSSVDGKTFYRPGTQQILGGKRVYDPPLKPDEDPRTRETVTRWQADRVIAIPAAEHERYLKEYSRGLREGALKARTEADWKAQSAADDKAASSAREAAARAQPEVAARMTEAESRAAAPAASATP